VQYRDWCYADVAKNPRENEDPYEDEPMVQSNVAATHHLRPNLTSDSISLNPMRRRNFTSPQQKGKLLQERSLGPRRLCFIDQPITPSATSPATSAHPVYTTTEVSDWQAQHPDAGFPRFLFVSYTAAQFFTKTREDMQGWGLTAQEVDHRSRIGKKTREELTDLGVRIARNRGLDAFWIDFECLGSMGQNAAQVADQPEPEVYAICDIVRATHSMVIVCGPLSPFEQSSRKIPTAFVPNSNPEWVAEWGARLWTLPELLLCPRDIPIEVYTPNTRQPDVMFKRNIAQLLEDGGKVRELVDHYDASIQLTPLELVGTAVECLFRRSFRQRYAGDVSYALMGLMRRRPLVNFNDSAFKAFARLSLANDSHQLLERLVCMQPATLGPTAWYDMDDAYGANLWDIEPCCQVAGIVDARPGGLPDPSTRSTLAKMEETQIITLDGACGGAIHWDSLQPAAFMKRMTGARIATKAIVRGTPIWLLMGIVMISEGSMMSIGGAAFYAVGTLFLVAGIVIAGFLPKLLISLYAGKFWSTQAMFFGMKGIPADLCQVERCLFGINQYRIRWSTHGSMLSQAVRKRQDGELEAGRPEAEHGRTVYTIVDTFTLTATAFYAERPPVAVIICGQEGGIQRAVLCSYDPVTRAFCREVVLRMKTLCLERMSRMDRLRFALRRM